MRPEIISFSEYFSSGLFDKDLDEVEAWHALNSAVKAFARFTEQRTRPGSERERLTKNMYEAAKKYVTAYEEARA